MKNKLKLFYISMTVFQCSVWTRINLVTLLIIIIINIILRHEIYRSEVSVRLIHQIQECLPCKDNNRNHRHKHMIGIWRARILEPAKSK